ncbi:DNA repair exonuclease [Castellaniella sp.]|uniref:metallophosphoesterase family protein n=1 Tax=Castellaniella sp. TaxID=1955812 RepID=UPI002AFF425F|nr:DNA repair exonuclease [Castellaniella sp.]
MPKILHTADWQIGRQYGRFAPEDAAVLADARLSTIERIASLAARTAVDAVLVAGDVFDTQTVSDRTIRRLFNALQAYSGPWVLIPGNHDAALAESVWRRAQRLSAIPPNAHVMLQADILEFPEQGLAILAAPLTQRQTYQDTTDWFDAAQTTPGLLRIGLAHGSIQGLLADDIDSSNPIAADRARRARLDYLALGDWHGLKQIDAHTWYSGTPEQERFKDNGAGQVLLVDLPAVGVKPTVTPHTTTQYHWQHWTATLTVASDLDQLLLRLQQTPAHAVLDLHLTGQIDLHDEQRLRQALSIAQGRCRSLQYDLTDLRLVPTAEDIAALRADGYLGEVIADLRDRQSGDEADTARDALIILSRLLRAQREAQP